jgi:HEAT repeat protein
MLNMIDDESASQRIKAVSYAEDMSSPNQQVIDVLVNTLNRDKNVNVRLAALYSLQRFADRRAVRDSLVNSLRNQTEPIIQVVLINLLAEKRDTRAIKPIQDIMTDKKTLKEVKEAAQRSLKTF